jgi:hypothetical protein
LKDFRLTTQMDYLDAADEIRLTIPPLSAATNQAPAPAPKSPPQVEREI